MRLRLICLLTAFGLLPVAYCPAAEPPLATQPAPAKSEELQQAEEAFRKGQFDDALAKLREAAKKNPALSPPRLILARMFAAANQGQPARLNLELALTEAPDHPECYVQNGTVALAENRVTDAILNLQTALQLAGAERWTADQRKAFQREARSGLAMAFERRGDWAAARGQLAALLELDSANTAARERMAVALFRMGKADESFAEWQTAAKNNPAADPAELNMARLYAARNDAAAGDEKQAEDWFQKALQKYAQNARVHQSYAEWLLSLGRLDAAKQHIETASQIDPKSRATRLLRGVLARREKNYSAAEKIFEELLRESPADLFAADQLALVLIEQSDPLQQQRAVQLAEVNARQNPRSAEALATLGWVYFRTGRVDDADKVLGQLISGGTAISPDAAYYVAKVLKEKGKPTEARKILEQALKSTTVFANRTEAEKFLAELPKPPEPAPSPPAGTAPPKPPQ